MWRRILLVGILALGCSSDPASPPGPPDDPADAGGSDDGGGGAVIGGVVTTVSIDPVAVATPVTFGHVFLDGDVPANVALALRTASGATLPTQLDRKASYPSGALRHGILSAVLPAGTSGQLELVRASPPSQPPRALSALLDSGFDATVTVTIDGRALTASARQALATPSPWLSGAVVGEWGGAAPLADTSGAHPHLHARFDVRSFEGVAGERVDVTLENDWAFEPGPQNLTYGVDLAVRGEPRYASPEIKHSRQTRWHRVLTPFGDVNVRYDLDYLARTGAVPTYDRAVEIAPEALESWGTATAAPLEPMQVRLLETYMPATGGRPDIGVLPAWTAGWLLSMDARARRAMLTVADSAAAFAIHYRDKATDDVVSLETYRDLTLLGNPGDTKHPFPRCEGDCTVPTSADTAHQPSMSYVPYLVTGDRFHLEELKFWAGYNAFSPNPAYREYEKGLLKSNQVRGFAWALRTLGHAAFIVPDADPQKKYLEAMLAQNLEWLEGDQVNGPKKNSLSILDIGYAVVYDDKTGFAPWQDDFFTSAVNVVARLGYRAADPILAYKARSPVARMRDACWIDAAAYSLVIRTSPASPFFETYKEAHDATFAELKLADGTRYLDLPCASQQAADFRTQYDKEKGVGRSPWAADEMTGYATSSEGYPSNMQPALAAAVDADAPGAKEAWATFASRSVKPTYKSAPQFAIVPR